MARTEGMRGMMKGNWTNCVRIIPNSAMKFFTYEQLSRCDWTTCAACCDACGVDGAVGGCMQQQHGGRSQAVVKPRVGREGWLLTASAALLRCSTHSTRVQAHL
jgi:hypothetical protein